MTLCLKRFTGIVFVLYELHRYTHTDTLPGTQNGHIIEVKIHFRINRKHTGPDEDLELHFYL